MTLKDPIGKPLALDPDEDRAVRGSACYGLLDQDVIANQRACWRAWNKMDTMSFRPVCNIRKQK